MGKTKSANNDSNTIALNRKASFDYHIESRIEAGIALAGWEIKSLRAGKAQIAEAHVIIRRNEIWLFNAVIAPLPTAATHTHPDPSRSRKLLLHKREINTLTGQVERKGYTIVPTAMYWKRNLVKVEIGLAKGKKSYDKRHAIKDRDWNREKQRLAKKS